MQRDGEQHSWSLPTRCQTHNTHLHPPDCNNQMCPHTARCSQGPRLLLMENRWSCGSYLMVGLTVFTVTSLGKKSDSKSRSVVSDSLQPHGLYSPWNSPGHNTGVGSRSLLQGIFLTQRSNPVPLALQADSLLSEPVSTGQTLYSLSQQESPASRLVSLLYLTV